MSLKSGHELRYQTAWDSIIWALCLFGSQLVVTFSQLSLSIISKLITVNALFLVIFVFTVSQKKNCFCQNFVKFPSILIIRGRWMTKWLKLYAMYTFSTSLFSVHYLVKHKSTKFYITLK